jgi:hypothetical protein
MWCILAVATALAGSATGPGAPVAVAIKDEFEPMVHMGVEGGGEMLLGSNGGAFGVGPSTRVWADVQDTNMYRMQVAWGWTGHELTDASKLFRGEALLTATDGYVSTHTVSAGAKVMVLAKEKKSSVRLIDPWVYTGVGLSLAFGQVAWTGIPEPVSTVKGYAVVDGGAGLDVRPAKILSFAPALRVSVHPGIRTDSESGRLSFEAQLAIQPSIGLAIHI